MQRIHIIMYHYVRDLGRSRYPQIKGLDVDLFRRQLDFLRSRFTIIRMEDLLVALDGGGRLQGDGRLPGCGNLPGGGRLPDNAALLTFDDGYIDNYTYVFPLLDEMGLQGSFFPPGMILEQPVLLDVNKIHFTLAAGDEGALYGALTDELDFCRGQEYDIPATSDLINDYAVPNRFDSGGIIFFKRMLQTVLPERLRRLITDKLYKQFVGVDEAVLARELYCDAAQFALMKRRGMYIGLHSSSHGWLGNMDKSAYERDISHALGYMDSINLIDKNAWVMNYPYGSWNAGVVEYIRQNGGVAGITTEAAVADLSKDNRYLLPRLDTNDYPPKSEKYKTFSV